MKLYHNLIDHIDIYSGGIKGYLYYKNGSKVDISSQLEIHAKLVAKITSSDSCRDAFDNKGNCRLGVSTVNKLHLESLRGLSLLGVLLKQRHTICNYILPYIVPFHDDVLYKYQKEGVDWLCSNKQVILADDMGLGKSIQVIAALSGMFNKGSIKSCIILSPKSLIKNWVDQFDQWAPFFSVISIVSPPKDLYSSLDQITLKFHVVVTNYESVRGCSDILSSSYFDAIVCDEAHRLRKNTSSINRTITLSDIKIRWLITGTPIEKDSLDVINLSSILVPNRISITDSMQEFRALSLLKRYALRRTKRNLIKNIPQPNEIDIFLDLPPCQEKYYNNVVSESLKLENSENYLKYFNMLRSAVEYVPECTDNVKISYVLDLLNRVDNDKIKTVVFSYLLDPLRALKGLLHQHTSLKVSMLDGSQSSSERFDIVSSFQADTSIDVILASMRAASEGLTLTSAHRVIFLNKWWNPSLNMQARDRVIRIGQTKRIDIYNLYVSNTIDETLLKIINKKSDLLDRLVENGITENAVASLAMKSMK